MLKQSHESLVENVDEEAGSEFEAESNTNGADKSFFLENLEDLVHEIQDGINEGRDLVPPTPNKTAALTDDGDRNDDIGVRRSKRKHKGKKKAGNPNYH